METENKDELIDKKIEKTHEEIQSEKREKLIKFITEVLVEKTMKEFYETREQAV